LGQHFGTVTHERTVGGMRVLEFEHRPNCPIPDHTHERAHIFFVLAGSIYEEDRGTTKVYRDGDAAFHPRGAFHSNVVGPDGSHLIAVEFEGDDLVPLVPLERLGRTVDLKADGKLIADAARKGIADLERAVGAVLSNANVANREPAWMAAVKEELDAHLSVDPDVAKLAALVRRHPAHLMRAFRRHTGMPLGEYVRAKRVARACETLLDPGAKLSDIAAAAGFADQSHFARTFKRFTNMTPDAYRKSKRR
jgi:AraC family transcriptional regulator